MMKLKVYNILLLICLSTSTLAQHTLTGIVKDASLDKGIANAEVFNKTTNLLVRTNNKGEFKFENIASGTYTLLVFVSEYNPLEQQVTVDGDTEITLALEPFSAELSEVVINQKREEAFSLNRLNPVEGTAIYAGKKSEVVLLDQLVGNMAANNARQIYSQVVGLNIYENGDAGLQLNIGGRGLDPNRTSNFNTRQNGYDISADVLGYPESYYTPPAEALSEIQVIRGAASLQYGTQFGGLINFKMKRPNPVKKLELVSRQTYGSYNLFTSFNSISGTVGKFSYYTYFNYKQGDGFRENSEFDSKNFYTNLNYAFTDKTSLSLDVTYLKYLAQQAGGLTDSQFNTDPTLSTRDRNWFEVDWQLYALKFKHKFSLSTDFSLNVFGLNAERNAVGFRGNPKSPEDNPVNSPYDPNDITRDLIKGKFQNWGAEARLLNRYKFFSKDAVFLIGTKYYHANNESRQGPSSNGFGPDFSFANDQHPDYPNQSDFDFPNRNASVFGENILFINDKFSVTPGFRFEYIKTQSIGNYRRVGYDLAGNEISRLDTTDNREFERRLMLLGIGASYNYSDKAEIYANASQNYRSVTFSDIRVVNPTFIVDPTITDEKGFTSDIGLRGKWNKLFSYDISAFALQYNDRIGTILVESGPDKGDRVRKNIGDAVIYGAEAFVDWNIVNTLGLDFNRYRLNIFMNAAFTDSKYTSSDENNVVGKKVEFIPEVNLKTGIKFGYKNLLGNIQYMYLSEQYSDAENSPIASPGDSREGVIGPIPAYSVLDVSLSYRYKFLKLETGINNLLDEAYFTRRATGYPGPGIIPAEPRTYYVTLEFRL